ncbi:MAG: 50S ribosomal protein L29 [Acidobacteria bacterium]|nr:50S ribosomal protein L29 [Acidobacteriota bacterium]
MLLLRGQRCGLQQLSCRFTLNLQLGLASANNVMTKIADLRELGVVELEKREIELADQVFRLRIQKSMGQEEAAGKVKGTRRDLARVQTLLRERRAGQAV